jgi:hypothetical protein
MCYQQYLKYCGGSSVAPGSIMANSSKNEGAYLGNPNLREQ